jgi:hypothetical protein
VTATYQRGILEVTVKLPEPPEVQRVKVPVVTTE